LTVIWITTAVTQIRPAHFGIRVNTINYVTVWILTNLLIESESSCSCSRISLLTNTRPLEDAIWI
jgi:hypothetical protein